MNSLERKYLVCLSHLMEHAERDGASDSAAALRWAVFTLENVVTVFEEAGCPAP